MHELKTHFNYYNFIQEWKEIIEKQMGISVGVVSSH
jgi:hypothetical protein